MNGKYYDSEKIISKSIKGKVYNIIISRKRYNIVFYSNNIPIDNLYVTNMNIAISQAIYSINHTNMIIIDQIRIYKNGNLIAELNK